MAEDTQPDESTADADEREAQAAHTADRPPTEDESAAADRAREDRSVSGDQQAVGEHFREMAERGVGQKGEGRID